MKFIVTMKMLKNPNHDPNNKRTGTCPVSAQCTDHTGQHHSFIMEGDSIEEARHRANQEFGHITRIEQAWDWS